MTAPTLRRFARALLLAAAPGLAMAADAPPVDPVDPGVPKVDFLHRFAAPGLSQNDEFLVLRPGAAWYPADEAATGAQGTAIVVMDLAPDGHVAKTTLAASTHAPALDAQALRLASQLHWMGARKVPPQASVRVLFARDTNDSVQQKTCVELNLEIAWLKAHDPAQPPEAVGALRAIRGLVILNSTWMPDRVDREAGQPARDALFVASRRTVDECAAHPEQRLKDAFNHLLHAAAQAHEHEAALPVPAATTGTLPRSILRTERDESIDVGAIVVHANDADYPAAALAAGQQGNVEVQADLGEGGAIEQVSVHRAYSRDPALAAAATEIFRRHLLAEAHLDKSHPAMLPAALLATVKFERDDSKSITSLDCATFRKDEAAWRGDRLFLPDYQTKHSALLARAFHLEDTPGRLPQREQWLSDNDRMHEAELKTMDAACGATPAKLAIDAFIDAIDNL